MTWTCFNGFVWLLMILIYRVAHMIRWHVRGGVEQGLLYKCACKNELIIYSVDDVSPSILANIKDHAVCTVETLLNGLLSLCLPEEYESDAPTDLLDQCLNTVLPICNAQYHPIKTKGKQKWADDEALADSFGFTHIWTNSEQLCLFLYSYISYMVKSVVKKNPMRWRAINHSSILLTTLCRLYTRLTCRYANRSTSSYFSIETTPNWSPLPTTAIRHYANWM
jgi:hypothetical protein